MVKNDAFKNLVPLIAEMFSNQLIVVFCKPLLEQLQGELMENMRQTMVDITMKLAEKLEEEKAQDIVPHFTKVSIEDDSWRVRKHAAENLSKICSPLKKDRVTQDITPLYIKLLADSEPQVRKSTILALESVIKTADGTAFAQAIVGGPLQTLGSDSVAEVRG